MRLFFIFCFCLIFGISKSQDKGVQTDIKTLQEDQKKLYDILLECISTKAKNKDILHIVPDAYVIENSEKISVGVYYYGEDYYQEKYYSPYRATYYATLTFEKDKPQPKGSYGIGTPHYSKEKTVPTYGFGVIDLDVKMSYYTKTEYVLRKKSDKPIFINDFKSLSYQSSDSHNKVDTELYPENYSHVTFVNKNFIIASKNGKYGIDSSKKQNIIPFEYEQIQVFKNNFLVKKNSKYFIISSKNEKISQEFDEFVSPFHYSSFINSNPELKDFFQVRINGKTTFINKDFQPVKPLMYDRLQFFNQKPLQFKASIDNRELIIDYQSFKEITPRYDHITKFDEQTYLIQNNSKEGITDLNNKFILDCIYDKIEIASNINSQKPETIYLILKKDNQFAVYYFATQTFVTQFEYDHLFASSNYIKVEKNGKFGIIDLKGNIVTPVKFDSISWNSKLNRTEALKNGDIFLVDEFGKTAKFKN